MGLLDAAFWGALAALSLLIGAVVALRLRPSARATGLVMGFGAGALLSAVAYELVPETVLAGFGVPLAVGAGRWSFFGADWLVDRRGGAERKDLAGGPTGRRPPPAGRSCWARCWTGCPSRSCWAWASPWAGR